MKTMTLAEALARIEELEASKATKLTVTVNEFGPGTVLIRGIRRFAVGYYPGEWGKIFSMQSVVDEYIAAHSNELRSQAFAWEACDKMKLEWDATKGADNSKFIDVYTKAYATAMKNPALVSSKSK